MVSCRSGSLCIAMPWVISSKKKIIWNERDICCSCAWLWFIVCAVQHSMLQMKMVWKIFGSHVAHSGTVDSVRFIHCVIICVFLYISDYFFFVVSFGIVLSDNSFSVFLTYLQLEVCSYEHSHAPIIVEWIRITIAESEKFEFEMHT